MSEIDELSTQMNDIVLDNLSEDEEISEMDMTEEEDFVEFEPISNRSRCSFGSDDLPPTLIMKKGSVTYCFTKQEALNMSRTKMFPYLNIKLLPDELSDVKKFLLINK